MKQIPNHIKQLIDKHGLDREAVWDCHGTPVLLHRACEEIAAKLDIRFEEPKIIHCDAVKKECVLLLKGSIMRGESEIEEWSFGEAMGYNLKNNYPFAMAEKRAKDRVILKLAGLHGVYSEEEADDFKESLKDGTARPVATAHRHTDTQTTRPPDEVTQTHRHTDTGSDSKPAWVVQLETRFGRNEGKVTNAYLKKGIIKQGQTWRDLPASNAEKLQNNLEVLCKNWGI
jgi:hypothetical protein